MVFNKFFYSLIIGISFGQSPINAIEYAPGGCDAYFQKLDRIAGKASEWYERYMASLNDAEQIEFYNGLLDMSEFAAYSIEHEKYIVNSVRLIGLLNKISVEDEADVLQLLYSMVQAAVKNYPIKTDCEKRVGYFYQRCEEYAPYAQALNCFVNDLKSFLDQEPTNFLLAQLESTKVTQTDFIEKIVSIQNQINAENHITKGKYEEKILPYYYDSLKFFGDDLCALTVQSSELQKVLNEMILIYTDAIIKNAHSKIKE